MKACRVSNENLDYVNYLVRCLPDVCKVTDLVKAGMYATPQAAYSARKHGRGPRYLHIPQRGIIYHKKSVIDFVRSLSA